MNDGTRKPIYVSNHDLKETFSDGVTAVGFDGANFRIELAISRVSQTSDGRETTLHPAARLVLPLHVAGDLLQKLSSALVDLEQQGVVKKGTAPGTSAQSRN